MNSGGITQGGGSRWRAMLLVAVAIMCMAAGAVWAFLHSGAKFAGDDSIELTSVTKHRNSPFASMGE